MDNNNVLRPFEVSPGYFKYPRRLFCVREEGGQGIVIAEAGLMEGALMPGLRSDEIFTFDTYELYPVDSVDLKTGEIVFIRPELAPIEDVAASLIQQGITPDMLSQIQETMVQQSAPIRQQTKTTE